MDYANKFAIDLNGGEKAPSNTLDERIGTDGKYKKKPKCEQFTYTLNNLDSFLDRHNFKCHKRVSRQTAKRSVRGMIVRVKEMEWMCLCVCVSKKNRKLERKIIQNSVCF